MAVIHNTAEKSAKCIGLNEHDDDNSMIIIVIDDNNSFNVYNVQVLYS